MILFSDVEIDRERREIRREGNLVPVQPQVFDLLVYVITNHQRVVTRDDLIEHVWHGRIVSESTLSSRINAARKAVGDNGFDQRLIVTVHGRGIRFIGIPRSDNTASMTAQPGRPNVEKANLYLPAFSGTCPLNIIDELQDILTSGFTGEPLYALIPAAPGDDNSVPGYHLNGVFRQTGDQIYLSVKLSNVETSSLIWAEQFDFPNAGDAMTLSRIADKIIGRTYADLHLDRTRQAKAKDDEQSGATELYYKSRGLIRTRVPADNFAAEKLVRRSIGLAPELFGGHMGLALIYLSRASEVVARFRTSS
jgi:DNA-binding winged helix-turn-helix (wHTH) protein